jgi:hypothetical protein
VGNSEGVLLVPAVDVTAENLREQEAMQRNLEKMEADLRDRHARELAELEQQTAKELAELEAAASSSYDSKKQQVTLLPLQSPIFTNVVVLIINLSDYSRARASTCCRS